MFYSFRFLRHYTATSLTKDIHYDILIITNITQLVKGAHMKFIPSPNGFTKTRYETFIIELNERVAIEDKTTNGNLILTKSGNCLIVSENININSSETTEFLKKHFDNFTEAITLISNKLNPPKYHTIF